MSGATGPVPAGGGIGLGRLLAWVLSGLLLSVYAVSFLVSVVNTREFLTAQLQAHAQDAATSLGMTLVEPLSQNDLVLAETLVNAMFDSGYYRRISVTRPDGGPLVVREVPVRVESVPAWFIRWLPLDAPEARSEVNTGWRIAATVQVRSHPGYAYLDLWRTSQQLFAGFGLALLVSLGVLALILRAVQRPLRAVERQAEAICEREFPVLKERPWIRELRRVVAAMNRMSLKLQQILADQAELTEKLRDQANRDPVTGLTNRRHFDARLQTALERDAEGASVAVFLYQLEGFKAYNDTHGYSAGDRLLQAVAHKLCEVVGEDDRRVVARLGGADFGILVQDISRQEAEALAERLVRTLETLYGEGLVNASQIGHLGVAFHPGGPATVPAATLLSEADMALRAAQSAGPNTWRLYHGLPPASVHGAGEWLEILRAALAERRIRLYCQPVLRYPDRRPLHREILARLVDAEGNLVPAGVFMPMAQRHGLGGEVDRLIVETVTGQLDPEAGSGVAVNLSPASLMDGEFRSWLCAHLEARPAWRGRLWFEAPEYGVVANLEPARRSLEALRSAGAGVGLDHFGAGFTSFGYLRSLKLDYLKVDGGFVRGIASQPDNRFFIQSLADIAHGLEMQLIAEAVEDEAEWEALTALHLDGAQGYFLGRPSPCGEGVGERNSHTDNKL